MNVKLLTGVILAVLTVVFIIQNTAVMELKFLFWTLSMSGALMAILVLSIGIILGWLMRGIFSRRKNLHRNR